MDLNGFQSTCEQRSAGEADVMLKAAVEVSYAVNCWRALGHMPSDSVLNKLAMQLVVLN